MLLNSISCCFRDIWLKRIRVTSLTFRGHETSSVAWPFDSHFLLVVLWNQASISNVSRDIQWRMWCDGWHDH